MITPMSRRTSHLITDVGFLSTGACVVVVLAATKSLAVWHARPAEIGIALAAAGFFFLTLDSALALVAALSENGPRGRHRGRAAKCGRAVGRTDDSASIRGKSS